MEFQSAAGFLGTIANTLDYDKGKFYLKLTGGFGGTITSLPAKNTQEVRVNIDGLSSDKGLRIATTTIPTPIKQKVVFYSDTKDSLSAGDVLMTFPSGTAVDSSAFTVKFATGVSAAGGEVDTKSVSNGDGTISLVVAQSDWTGLGDGESFSDENNWLGNVVPAEGRSVYIGVDVASTLVCDIDFRPSAITFMASSAAITIDGSGAISGITAITNLSTASHTINAPVYFTSGINVKQNAVAYDTIGNSHVTFAGGAYAGSGQTIDSGYSVAMFGRYYFANTAESPWTATESANGKRTSIADNSCLYVPYAGNLHELYVGSGAKAFVGDMNASDRTSWNVYGEMTVTNLTITGSGDKYMTWEQGNTPGVFKFEAVTNSMSSGWVYLSDGYKASKHVFYIGAGGLNFSSGIRFCIGNNKSGNTETVRPWYSDFTIADNDKLYSLVLHRNVEFCTDDESGTGRTITIDAITRADDSSVYVTVSGSGKVKVNRPHYNNYQPTVTVTNTATLAIKPGAGLGESAMTVNTGATLEVPESGTVTLAGNLTLASGAALAFKLNGNSETTLALASGKTLTASESVNIKFAEGSVFAPDKAYTLVSGANLAEGDEAKFALPQGNRGTLSVVEGNLVYTAPKYFYIKVK